VLVLILHEEVLECWQDSHHVPVLAPKEAGVPAPLCSSSICQSIGADFLFDVNHDLWPPDKHVEKQYDDCQQKHNTLDGFVMR
jgi:hypothetical protein